MTEESLGRGSRAEHLASGNLTPEGSLTAHLQWNVTLGPPDFPDSLLKSVDDKTVSQDLGVATAPSRMELI